MNLSDLFGMGRDDQLRCCPDGWLNDTFKSNIMPTLRRSLHAYYPERHRVIIAETLLGRELPGHGDIY